MPNTKETLPTPSQLCPTLAPCRARPTPVPRLPLGLCRPLACHCGGFGGAPVLRRVFCSLSSMRGFPLENPASFPKRRCHRIQKNQDSAAERLPSAISSPLRCKITSHQLPSDIPCPPYQFWQAAQPSTSYSQFLCVDETKAAEAQEALTRVWGCPSYSTPQKPQLLQLVHWANKFASQQ